MMKFEGYSTLWKAVIRPPRFEYELSDMGPEEFTIKRMRIKRTDLEIKSSKGHTLKCSHYEPFGASREWEQLPCVIYLHGNSSSRLEALDAVPYLLPSNITLFCFDFAGCGQSEGEYISLGWYERDDLAIIVEHLRKERRVSTIGLWGRSMGAVTSLLHGDRDPSIGGMVLDSPFSNMKQLVSELAKSYTKIPSLLVSGALKLVRSTVQSKAGFDIYNLSPMDHVKECFIPALFAAGKQDTFIQPHHTEELYNAYAGDKNKVLFDGDHNTPRPSFFHDSVVIFFHQTLQIDVLLTEANKIKKAPGAKSNANADYDEFEYDDVDFYSQQMLYQQLQGQKSMGEFPVRTDELKQIGVFQSKNPKVMGDMAIHDEEPEDGVEEDEFAGMSEEEIMKRVMEESLKSAQEEEEKRNVQGGDAQELIKPNQKKKQNESEEDYLLECMQKVEINAQQQQQQQQQNNGGNNSNDNNGNQVKSIDDLLNL